MRCTTRDTTAAALAGTRYYRTAYAEGPEYIPLLLKSYELWSDLEASTGTELRQPSGLITIAPEDDHRFEPAIRTAAAYDLQHEILQAPAPGTGTRSTSSATTTMSSSTPRAGSSRPGTRSQSQPQKPNGSAQSSTAGNASRQSSPAARQQPSRPAGA
jgi:hypothetical protein